MTQDMMTLRALLEKSVRWTRPQEWVLVMQTGPSKNPASSIQKALAAVIQEACIQGVSTRSVDDLVQAMGMSGISKSQVSRLCGEIDDKVNGFLDRSLEGEGPYLWLDATYVKVREAGRIVSVAVTVAVAVNEGRREVLPGASEAEAFSEFLSLAGAGCVA